MKNGVMMQYFEWNLPNDGQLWKQLKEDAPHLAERGITAVWIPPAYKADEQADEGYATYDLYDFGEFDQKGSVRTKYGTRAQLHEAIEALHANGVQVLLDAVLNHKAGGDYAEQFNAIEVMGDNRNEIIGKQRRIEAMTGYSFPGRGDKYSSYKWHWSDFSGVDYDSLTDTHAIFRITGKGKGWSQGVDSENGNYDYLLANDIDLDRPQVRRELFRWGRWATEQFGFDGFRMDAIKHMDYNFTRDFVADVRAACGEQFYVVGEYWSGDIDTLEDFIEHTGGTLDIFDAPLHYNFHGASEEGSSFDMATLLDGTLVERHPELAVTLVDNHDSQPGSSLESSVADWFKPMAYALILLMSEGYPVIFYGDYYSENRVASPHRHIIDLLLDLRRSHALGEQTLYFDHPSCVGLVRHGVANVPGSGLVLLMSNDLAGNKEMSLGPLRAGETWHEVTGAVNEDVVLDAEGTATFTVPARSLAVWVRKQL